MLFSGHVPIHKQGKPHDIAIASAGVAESVDPTLATGRSSRSGEAFLKTIVIVGAVIGLCHFASHVTRQAPENGPLGGSDAFMVARTEVLHLWLPKTLIELAKSQAQSRCFGTHEELQRFLELRHEQDVWCAMTIRIYQINGTFGDVTYIRRPYYDRHYFQEFLAILATAAGSPPYYPDYPTSSFLIASVHVITEEFLGRQPREAMADLLTYPALTADDERMR